MDEPNRTRCQSKPHVSGRTVFAAPLSIMLVILNAAVAGPTLEFPVERLLSATHVHGLAVDRAEPTRLLIATHHGLFLLRRDGIAELRSPTQDDFMGFQVHPSEPNVLFASGHPSTGGNLGVLRSEDGGRQWTKLSDGVGGPVDFHQMSISKADPEVIYGVHGGLQVSRDGGLSWTQVSAAPDGIIALAASATDPDRLYAATRGGLLYSEDGGGSWSSAHFVQKPTSLAHTTSDGRLYAFIVGLGLVETKEPGFSWKVISNGFGDAYPLHLADEPGNPNRLYIFTSDNRLLESADGGATWQPFGTNGTTH